MIQEDFGVYAGSDWGWVPYVLIALALIFIPSYGSYDKKTKK